MTTPRTDEELIALLRGRKLPVMGGAGVYEVVLDERPDALCAEAAARIETLIAERDALVAAMERIAERLVEQRDEPWPSGSEGDRLHYWRDKAIAAADQLRALNPEHNR